MSEDERIKSIQLEYGTDDDGNVITKDVRINTQLKVSKLRKLQNAGLLPKSFFSILAKAENNPEELEPFMMTAAYAAYSNANTEPMTQEEFESHLNLDFELFGKILSEIVGGTAKEGKLSSGFKRATKTKK